MKCKKIHILLSDYLEDSLDLSERNRVEQHLEECDSCRLKLKEMRQLYGVLAQDKVPQMEEDFWINFLPQVRSRIEKRKRPKGSLVPKTRLALGFLSLLLVVLIGYNLFHTDLGNLAKVDLNQNMEITVTDPTFSSAADQLADALSAESTQSTATGVILSEEEKEKLDLTVSLLTENYLSQKEIGSILDELNSDELKQLEENINKLNLATIL
ncbi:MAG: zf-HC2 domain-containing protein [Candidatus Zixiibacteriota bacterium]